MYVSMKPILQHAHEHGYAVPAINCINMEMARGAVTAAQEAGRPSSSTWVWDRWAIMLIRRRWSR